MATITKEQKRQFILDTLLPYRQNPSNCAIGENGGCLYLTESGKKCAVGRHMKEGSWQKIRGASVGQLLWNTQLTLKDILTEEANSMKFKLQDWELIQSYHDYIALNYLSGFKNGLVKAIENRFGVELPELYFNED